MNVGFIILRHVDSENTNKYWIRSYKSIRDFYPDNMILIIDDNSDYSYVTDEKLHNAMIVNSEYPKRGELLPYYYYLQYRLFDIAVIIHDSVFVQKCIDFTDVDKYKMLWTFEHSWDQIEDETRILNVFNDDELLEFHKNKSEWEGCFGAMCVITYDYLKYINDKYDISKLLDVILIRYNRCSFERVIACLLQKEYKTTSMYGDIHKYCPWGVRLNNVNNNNFNYDALPLLKVWSGR